MNKIFRQKSKNQKGFTPTPDRKKAIGVSYANAQRGFTLIEMLVVIFVFTLLGVGVVTLVTNVVSTSNKEGQLSGDADQARKTSFRLMSELRNAGLSSIGSYAIAQADDQQLIFYANVDADSDMERIRYYVSGGKLYRGVINPTGNPLTYVAGNEVSKVVQNNLANGANPLFLYYPDTYTGTGAALTQPVNIVQIKYIKMDLRVYNKGGSTGNNYFSVEAGAAIRSLKTNLGS